MNNNNFIIKNGVLVEYKGKDKKITLPDGLHSIGDYVFWGCDNLQSITLPDGLQSIGYCAFWGCDNLQSITLPDGLQSIKENAFFGCKNLQSITLPNGLQSIEKSTFRSCKNLQNINFPNGLQSIGKEAFYDCENLQSITLPDGLQSIKESTFCGCFNLNNITLPSSLKSIGNYAFSSCSNLQSITLPDSLQSIEDCAFCRCSKLKEIEISENNSRFCSDSGIIYNKDKTVLLAFPSASGNVILQNDISKIYSYAFTGCKNLQSITLPDGLQFIEKGTFEYCENLQSITLPDGLQSIGESAFKKCTNLKNITLPDGLQSIGESAFEYCKNLQSITLPDNLRSIGQGAFDCCYNLENIKTGKSVKLNKSSFSDDVPALKKQFRKLQMNMSDGLVIDLLKSSVNFLELPLDVQAEIFIYHHNKQIIPFISKAKSPYDFGKELLELKDSFESKKVIATIEMFMEIFYNAVSADLLREMYNTIKSTKGSSAALKKIKNISGLMNVLIETENTSSLEAEKWVLKKSGKTEALIEASFYNYYKRAAIPDIYDKEGNKLSPFVIKWILLLSEGMKSFKISEMHKEDTELIKLLDHDKFMEALWFLFETNKFTFIFPICLYADDELMKRLSKNTRDYVFRLAALHSNTRTAMLLADKYSILDSYAALRGIDEEVLRDKYMSDIGIDENGRKFYDLGSQTVTAELQKDLKFILISEEGKILKSLPKKDADPEKYEQAKLDFSKIKKDSKRIVKNRIDTLFSQFLSGTIYDPEKWEEAYLKNPLLRSVAQLVVWQQDDNTFSINDSCLYMSDGKAYILNKSPICLAHPMDMKAEDIEAWQKYFNKNNLKQPFIQIWEPFVSADMVKRERYKGFYIKVHDLGKRQKHGIHVRTSYDGYDGYFDIYLQFDDCSIKYSYHPEGEIFETDSNNFEITDFSFDKYTRKVNHIVAYLDKITICDRIEKDDISINDMLPNFTLAQITEFIKLAVQNNSVNVTALLMDYKNEHFADYNPMEEFTLGEL